MINSKPGQSPHLGRHDIDAAMVRLVAELRERLDESGLLDSSDAVAIDNVVAAFVKSRPVRVQNDLLHG
jgi:hypothetical protein